MPRRINNETGAERTRKWLQILGINLQAINFIHVAGTKGKGSVCLFTESLLSAYQSTYGSPVKIGCLTSPHTSDVRERIRLNGVDITKDLFAHYVWTMSKAMRKHSDRILDGKNSNLNADMPGYPSFLTLLAFYVFAHEQVDVAVIETGIGGETDSTNVVSRPSATGITSLGLDHTDVLGHSLSSIAWHKSGIFKEDSTAFTVPQNEEALEVLRTRSVEKKVRGQLSIVDDTRLSRYGIQVYPDMQYQRYNASLAIAMAESTMLQIDERCIMTETLARAVERTDLPGRNDTLLGLQNTWLISTAHNTMSMEQAGLWFAQEVTRYDDVDLVLLFNHESSRGAGPILKTLYDTFCAQISGRISGVVFCSNQSGIDEVKQDFIDPRRQALQSSSHQEEIGKLWVELGGRADFTILSSVNDAVSFIDKTYKNAVVIVGGSLYLAGKVRFIIHNQPPRLDHKQIC